MRMKKKTARFIQVAQEYFTIVMQRPMKYDDYLNPASKQKKKTFEIRLGRERVKYLYINYNDSFLF